MAALLAAETIDLSFPEGELDNMSQYAVQIPLTSITNGETEAQGSNLHYSSFCNLGGKALGFKSKSIEFQANFILATFRTCQKTYLGGHSCPLGREMSTAGLVVQRAMEQGGKR